MEREGFIEGEETHFVEKDGFASIVALVMYQAVEHIRCVRLASGQIVYEFWTDGTKFVRFDAAAYDNSLRIAREKMQDEVTL